jgi:RNA polymerase sigma-70 factor (ECF subfamily)
VAQPETRPSLIVRLQDPQNERAWTEFVCAYEPFLAQLVRRQGTPERHVPDVTQQLLFTIARSVDGWRDDGREASFRRWLGRVARNVVLKFLDRERKQVGGLGGTDFLHALHQAPDAAADDARRQEYERELILWAAELVRSDFRETSWRAFWATQVEGREVADVAAELGVSAGSIYMSRSRILARIRVKVLEILEE